MLLGAALAGAGCGTAARSSTTAVPEQAAFPTPTPTLPPSPSPFAHNATASCAEAYERDNLAGRAFAFDGTVVAVSPPTRPAAATFEVRTWFTGGTQPSVTIRMPSRPNAGGDPSGELGTSYDVGSRLLVSGEPRWGGPPLRHAIAWPCGFIRPYTTADARRWRSAFRAVAGH